ncbi:marvel domain-containing protein [Amylocarpus encephaloides]|uniref:Marvel domain-containing protein n=1 Tax=Amylocarpus encephaloides TaxID=45428 RepID=A0A9P7YL19_9HELO|nr:marvel domain-containing protein [Amylocarpus encephaloides]
MIVTLAVRVLQVLFSIVVLALSVVLIKGWGPETGGHEKPTEEALKGYGAFCGGAGILIAVVGVVACFIEKLQGIVILALDAVASFFLLAGGIAYAAKVGVGNCGDITKDSTIDSYMGKHLNMFRSSKYKDYDGNAEQRFQKSLDDIGSRCRIFQAETAFLWFMSVCFVVTLALTFLSRSGKRGGAMV